MGAPIGLSRVARAATGLAHFTVLRKLCTMTGVPEGVFNLVNGAGPTVGTALSSHAGIDMISFTDSSQGAGRDQRGQRDRLFDKTPGSIAKGIELVPGGVGRPDGPSSGYYLKPTLFANVKNSMTIARAEIFGPVRSILAYRDDEEAIANDTPYGLSGYLTSGNGRKWGANGFEEFLETKSVLGCSA